VLTRTLLMRVAPGALGTVGRMQKGVSPRANDPLPADVGERLRGVRQERGIGLRELSRRLGVSASALSQIETGRTRPSVMTLCSIVSELEMSLDDLLRVPAPRFERAPVVVPEGAPARAEPGVVLHPDDRRTIDLGTGVCWERLTPLAEPGADFLLVTYEPGSSSSWEPAVARRPGRAYGLVLSGRIRIALGTGEHELGPQDSIALDASLPHRIDNVDDEPAIAIWCTVGPAQQ
jgi:transcriptional regulator with XRE-family HTH domain